MSTFFTTLVRMSLSAAYLTAVVLMLRVLLRKAPKWTYVVLWSLVAVRLLCPVSPHSRLSLSPGNAGELAEQLAGYEQWEVTSKVVQEGTQPVALRDDGSAFVLPQQGEYTLRESHRNPTARTDALACVWIVGMSAMLIYALFSYLRLRRRVAASIEQSGVWLCDDIDTPFILGVFRPRVYLPSALAEPQRSYVLAHERAHLARRDHWWKPLGFALLAVYWFNPALWLAYILFCRDVELACDERVYQTMGCAERVDYSQTLLAQSRPRSAIAACPLAFGETAVKDRIRAALNYKKPAFWIVACAVIACAVVAVCFLTDPKTKADAPTLETLAAGYSLEQAKADGCLVMENGTVTAGKEAFLDFTAKGAGAALRVVNYYTLDEADCSAEYYEKNKDDYPCLFVQDLSYDGTGYTLRGWEDGVEYVRHYRFLRRFECDNGPTAQNRYSVRFVLTDDADATWERLMQGALSSQSGDWIDFTVVCQEYLDHTPLPRLTLDDVRTIAQKGEALSARDFDGYEYIVTGSGLYIKLYPVEESYGVALGFARPDADEPIYCYLTAIGADGMLGDTVDLRTGDVEAFIAAHTEPSYRAEGTVFIYRGTDYDLTEQNPAINSIVQVCRVGRYYLLEGHVNPANGVFCVFDTQTERFIKSFTGANFTWWNDDLTTALYSFWGDILDYDGNLIAHCDLADGEYIYGIGLDDDGTVLVTVMGADGALREERYARSGAPTAQVESAPAVHASATPQPVVDAPRAEQTGEPDNTMVVVIDLSDFEGEEP